MHECLGGLSSSSPSPPFRLSGRGAAHEIVVDRGAMPTHEVYVSTDVETDGPIPGPHSMLAFGSVAFDETGAEIGTFARNLETLPGAVGHPSTLAWWAGAREHEAQHAEALVLGGSAYPRSDRRRA